jgi:acetolactate synthase-1/2/3 large subunit
MAQALTADRLRHTAFATKSIDMSRQLRSRGADALALVLKNAGVKRVFTLSGNHIMSVFDALIDTDIELVHTRHEAAAVHMADACARLTGEPAVALVTGGPGHANAAPALYTARMAESPVILLSGHAPNSELGRGAFQELPQAEMARPVSKAAWTCGGSEEVAPDLVRALRLARSGRPGPVNLNLPSDALEGTVGSKPQPTGDGPRATQHLDRGSAMAVLDRLAHAARPIILVGPSLMSRPARARLAALEDACGVPVIGMESPRGMADPSLGAFAQMLAQADCVLLVGKRLDFTIRFGRAPVFQRHCEFLQIDPEQTEINRSIAAVGSRLAFAAVAEIFPAVEALTEKARRNSGSRAWFSELKAALAYRPTEWQRLRSSMPGRVHPLDLLRPLQAVLDSHADAVFISDGGEIGQWAQACLHAPQRLTNGPAGAIGAGLPFALGARFAQPDAPIIATMGDGTFGFHMAELDTAVTHKLPFVAVIGNDAKWNAEYQIQLREFGGNRARGCEMRQVRYDQVAMAMGAHGELVTDAEGMAPAVARAFASGLPACMNVMIESVAAPQIARS